MNLNRALFDVNVCYECNYRCTYCSQQYQERAYRYSSIREDVIRRYAAYIKYMRSILPNDTYISVQFYGGEPLLHFDRIAQFVLEAEGAANVYTIVSNGSLVEKYHGDLLDLNHNLQKFNSRICVSVSYDFIRQNETRCPNSYESIRDAIRWLCHNNMLRKIITVFNADTISSIDKVFLDFIELRKECSNAVCRYNLSLEDSAELFDEKATIRAMRNINKFIDLNPESRRSFCHNAIGIGYWHNSENVYRDIVNCVDVDGEVYSDYSILHREDNTAKELTHYGSIFDDFDNLNTRQKEIVSALDLSIPKPCQTCDVTCRSHPGLQEWNAPYHREACRIRRLLHRYSRNF